MEFKEIQVKHGGFVSIESIDHLKGNLNNKSDTTGDMSLKKELEQ